MVALAQRRHGRLGGLQRDPLHCRDVRRGQEGIYVQETSELVQEREKRDEGTGAVFGKVFKLSKFSNFCTTLSLVAEREFTQLKPHFLSIAGKILHFIK